MALDLFSEAGRNIAAGVLAALAAEILQLPKPWAKPGAWFDVARRIHRESKRAAYRLEQVARRAIQEAPGDKRHE